ncbi:MAG: hypothetical protein ABR927_14820 [Bacteroidales bacterium]
MPSTFAAATKPIILPKAAKEPVIATRLKARQSTNETDSSIKTI